MFEVGTRTSNLLFDFSNLSNTGWRVSSNVTWRNAARLVHVQHNVDISKQNVNIIQQAQQFS